MLTVHGSQSMGKKQVNYVSDCVKYVSPLQTGMFISGGITFKLIRNVYIEMKSCRIHF